MGEHSGVRQAAPGSAVPSRRAGRGARPPSPVLVVAAALVLTAAGAAAAELDLEVEAVSGYLFRGMLLNPEACLQPDVSLGIGNLSLGAWASIDLTDALARAGEIAEVDLSLAYAGELAGSEVIVGITHYRVSSPEAGHTTELLADMTVPWAAVEMRLGLAWDVDAARGVWVRAALGRTFELATGLTLDLEAGSAWADAGMNGYNFGVARPGAAEASASAQLEHESGGAALWIRVAASWLWRDELRLGAAELYGDASPVAVAAGLSITLPRER